jgi:hypothetical protein
MGAGREVATDQKWNVPIMTDYPEDLPEGAPHDYDVGYGQPPLVRRFKMSGNPGGRPKGAKNRQTIVRQVAREAHTVIEDGREARRSTLELVLIRLRNMAIEGKNTRAAAELFKLHEKFEPRILNPDAGVAVTPAPMSAEDWIAEAERRNAVMQEHGFRNVAEVAEFERQQREKKKPE